MGKLKVKTWRSEGVARIKIDLEEHDPTHREVDPLDLYEEIGDFGISDSLTFGYNRPAPLEATLANELMTLNTEEIGDDGTAYNGGINNDKDAKWNYRPYNARGLKTDYGIYQQAWLDEIGIMRPWTDITNALRSGDWFITAPDEAREERAEALERALKDIQGGWDKFIQDACYALISGFVLFEEVWSLEDMTLDKLSFRHPKQVVEWILDEDNRDLVAVKMARGEIGQDYYLPASAILHLAINAFGNDFEGTSYLRPVIKYSLAKDLFAQLEALAGEKFGLPIFVLKSDGETAADEDEVALLTQIYKALAGEDAALIELPDGKTFEMISPSGVMPDFTELKRYCDEQISLALQGEGNLLGMQGKGSLALAEVADNKAMRVAPSIAKIICNAINGSRHTPYQGTLRKLERLIYGEPEDGQWCQLDFAYDRNGRDSTWFDNLSKAVQAQLVVLTDDDKDLIRKELGLSKLPRGVA